MTTAHILISLIAAPVVGFIAGYVIDHIHKAAAPRIVRLHSDDRAWLQSIEYRLRIARIRAALWDLQEMRP
jgi:hypothetical protein